jgi:UDP-N-acetylglucosamine 2-epimerase (non-hydrolysing)
VIVLRATTERPEGVTAGAARLVGTDPDVIVSNASDLIANEAARKEMRVVESPYGDGRAANRIRECLEDGINP